eukprot:g76278.t1
MKIRNRYCSIARWRISSSFSGSAGVYAGTIPQSISMSLGLHSPVLLGAAAACSHFSTERFRCGLNQIISGAQSGFACRMRSVAGDSESPVERRCYAGLPGIEQPDTQELFRN